MSATGSGLASLTRMNPGRGVVPVLQRLHVPSEAEWSQECPRPTFRSTTVHDAVAFKGNLDSLMKILYYKDLQDARVPSRPSTGNVTPAF